MKGGGRAKPAPITGKIPKKICSGLPLSAQKGNARVSPDGQNVIDEVIVDNKVGTIQNETKTVGVIKDQTQCLEIENSMLDRKDEDGDAKNETF